MSKWILFDVSYLAYRAHYTTGHLSYEGNSIGVSFGVIRDIECQTELHGAEKVVLAFDNVYSLRKVAAPWYKANRRQGLTDEEKDSLDSLYRQVDQLKCVLLPTIGYRNIIEVHGYEADDVIASAAQKIPDFDRAVIVSADQDLYQCIRKNVWFYNPSSKKTVDYCSFVEEWSIPPTRWAQVKALAGCPSDNLLGVKGIGEKSAADYLSGKLRGGKRWQLIRRNIDIVGLNLPLVELPYPGLVLPEIVDDEITEAGKFEVYTKLGIRGRRGVGAFKSLAEKQGAFI